MPEDLKERLAWVRRIHAGLWIFLLLLPVCAYFASGIFDKPYESWFRIAVWVSAVILMINTFLVIRLLRLDIKLIVLEVIRLEKKEAAKKDGSNIYQIGGGNAEKVA